MHKVLFVDDEEGILHGFQRLFRKKFFVEIAVGANQGLEVLEQKGPFSVVVSDFQMPNMNGVEFLHEVKKKSPDSTRVILTGQADMDAVIDSINHGNIFRFLNKPCDNDNLSKTLEDCIHQYELVTSEKLLLEQTLKGSVAMMQEILDLARPDIFSKSSKIKQYIIQVYHILKIKRSWSVELAAMFYFIGAITLPEDLIQKLSHGEDFTDIEKEIYRESDNLKISLLKNIPRLGNVIKVLQYTDLKFEEFTDLPNQLESYDMFVLGAQILKIAISLERLASLGKIKPSELIQTLASRTGFYNPKLLPAFESIIIELNKSEVQSLNISQLTCNMLLEEDIKSTDGAILILKGQLITEPILVQLKNFSKQDRVVQPIKIRKIIDSLLLP